MTTSITSVTSNTLVPQTGLQQRAKLRKQTAAAEEARETVAERTREKLAGESTTTKPAAVTQPTSAPASPTANVTKPKAGQVLDVLG